MNPLTITTRRVALVAGVLAASCAIAACGSSSSSGSSSTNESASASTSTSTTGSRSGFDRSTFFACLKSHGVTLPSRPQGSGTGTTPGAGGGFFGGGGTGGGRGFFGGAASNPKFRAAFQACGGGNFTGRFRGGAGAARFRLSHTAIDNFVACVRKNGFPQMPAPNFSGKGAAVFPRSIESNAKFQAASRACASLLRPQGSGGTPGGTSTTVGS